MLYRLFFKRVFDFIISFSLLVFLSPILLAITITLLFINKGRPFYLQYRPGKNKKGFNIIKFKSMKDTKDDSGVLLPDYLRVTRFGKIIRKYSIDELPQLINVLIGKMSIIGPRPLLFDYIPLYSSNQIRRHDVKPGITGWAQVNGRNSISWTEKFAYDVWYVDNISLLLDIKILFLTVKKVLKKENIDFSSAVKERRFNGNN